MKKIFFLFALILISFSSFSQDDDKDIREYFTDLLAEECGGYTSKEISEKGAVIITITLPSYYDFDLVQMSVSKIRKEYRDITVYDHWKALKMDNGVNYIGCILIIAEKPILVNYFTKGNYIMLYYEPTSSEEQS